MRWGAVCGVGGGIFAKTAKTPPLQSALHVALRPNIAHFSPVAMRIPCTTHAARLWGPYNLYHDAACRVVIWTSSLPSMGILRFLQRRVVILPFAIPVDPPMGANDGRCGIPRNDLPANADCRGGVFATRRFPRPPPRLAHTVHPARWRPRSLCCDVACRVAAQNRQAAPLIAMRRATSLQTPPKRCVAFPPKKYRDFKMPHRALYHPKCYVVSQHAALRLGIFHCGVYSTPPFTARCTQQSAR